MFIPSYKKDYNKRLKESGNVFILNNRLRRRLHKFLLDMYIDIDNACKKHGIPLFLGYGTALGAIRHKGFIPWDDDIDLCMMRSDYELFSRFFDEELGDKYILNASGKCENPIERFPKILRKNTRMKSFGNILDDDHALIFLDIFIIENIPKNRLHRIFKGILCNFLEGVASKVNIYENRKKINAEYKKIFGHQYVISVWVGFIFSFFSYSKWILLIDSYAQHHQITGIFSVVTCRDHYFSVRLSYSDIFPPRKIIFEGRESLVYNAVEKHLSSVYGDYMKIPKKSERESHFIEELSFNQYEL